MGMRVVGEGSGPFCWGTIVLNSPLFKPAKMEALHKLLRIGGRSGYPLFQELFPVYIPVFIPHTPGTVPSLAVQEVLTHLLLTVHTAVAAAGPFGHWVGLSWHIAQKH